MVIIAICLLSIGLKLITKQSSFQFSFVYEVYLKNLIQLDLEKSFEEDMQCIIFQ